MSDLENRNAEAVKIALELYEKRLCALETKVMTLTNHNQTLMNLMNQLQRTNTLALQKVRGHGATDGHNS